MTNAFAVRIYPRIQSFERMKFTTLRPKYWNAWLLVPFLWFLSLFPMSMIYGLGTALGNFFYRIAPSRRKIALRNLELCFPERPPQEIQMLARETFRNIARVTLSSGIGWWAGRDRLTRLVQLKHSVHYERALKSGRNLILLAPHFVALEIGGIYLSMTSPIASIYQRGRNPVFDQLTLNGRSRFGAILAERKSDARRLIREMKKGTPLYYLPDQDPGIQWDPRRAVFAPFFGIQTATWATLARLASLTNALVLPCATKILSAGQGFEVIFGPPLENFPSGDPLLDATSMNRVIEVFIRDMPDQYFWAHRRFKTQPPGSPDYYAQPPVAS
jgi:KDO2-lipid IV(A) lauroyltransferase